ncbi:hypothetical protein NUW58_g8205 [Xylaria curta]|uniref:Uncharacterized protein n=1 Tax=Xylaria curta TaxID=42375 RepID=A0ACC1NBW3_9PEZI|nr:hypothetical protein NUW58_g8205 [Xylaria curta]
MVKVYSISGINNTIIDLSGQVAIALPHTRTGEYLDEDENEKASLVVVRVVVAGGRRPGFREIGLMVDRAYKYVVGTYLLPRVLVYGQPSLPQKTIRKKLLRFMPWYPGLGKGHGDWISGAIYGLLLLGRRGPSESESEPVSSPKTPALDTQFDIFKSSLQLPKATGQIRFQAGEVVTLYGFIGKRRDKGSNLSFCDIDIHLTSFAPHTPSSPSTPSTLQIVSNWEEEGSQQHTAHLSLKSIPAYSPVLVRGTLENIKDTTEANDEPSSEASVRKLEKKYEVRLEFVQCLNTFPKDIIVSKDAVWPPKSRHLQIRFDPLLYERLKFRSDIAGLFGQKLREAGFTEVETPVLFKSTPEGAREFLVPTRQKGFAYALPQSPQQYKQLLMASGVKRYFQLAKCFRDEDHRADRQPEFTQLDIEMAFATMGRVIKLVSSLIRDLDKYLQKYYAPVDINGVWHPRSINRVAPDGPRYNLAENTIQNIRYDMAMNQYGTDKPDLRLRSHISNITKISEWLSEDFKRMITSLKDPTVEACKFRFTGSSEESAEFIRDLFDTLPNTPHKLSGDSTPGVFVFDSSKPLQGLSALGHEAAEMLVGLRNKSWPPLIDGDVVIVHARKRAPHRGGSTELGRLRKLIYDTAVEKGLLPKDRSFHFCWVTRFPLVHSERRRSGMPDCLRESVRDAHLLQHRGSAACVRSPWDLVKCVGWVRMAAMLAIE